MPAATGRSSATGRGSASARSARTAGVAVLPLANTTFSAMNLGATFESIDIEVMFTGDAAKTAVLTPQFKKTADSGWRAGLPLWRVDPADRYTAPIDAYSKAFYGSILLCTHNTPYDVRVVATDSGEPGKQTVMTGSVTTRNDNLAAPATLLAGTIDRFVATGGSDAAAGTAVGTAWRTLEKARASAPSGAVVRVGPGYYAPPTGNRATPLTYVAEYPAINDSRAVINSGNHAVVEGPNVAAPTGTTAHSAAISDNPYTVAPWTAFQVQGTGGGGGTAGGWYGGNGTTTDGTLWKWTAPPYTATEAAAVGYHATRGAAARRVWHCQRTGFGTPLSTVANWAEMLYTNLDYNDGGSYQDASGNLYINLPANAPSADPNTMWITIGHQITYFDCRADDSRISGLEIRAAQYGVYFPSGSAGAKSRFTFDHNYVNLTGYAIRLGDSGGRTTATRPSVYGSDHVYQYNRFEEFNLSSLDPVTDKPIPWWMVKEGVLLASSVAHYTSFAQCGETGVALNETGAKRAVWRYNTVIGGFDGVPCGATYSDLGGTSTYDRYAGYANDCHDNLIQMCADDGLNALQQNINGRLWNNRVERTLTFCGVGPTECGPTYFFRNVGWEIVGTYGGRLLSGFGNRDAAPCYFKFSGGSLPKARIYLLNNTWWTSVAPAYWDTEGAGLNASPSSLGGTEYPEEFYMRNNIIRTNGYVWRWATAAQVFEDYNLWVTDDTGKGMRIGATIYQGTSGLATYRGLVAGGASHTNVLSGADLAFQGATPAATIDALLTDPANGDLTLKAGTNGLVGIAVELPNVNDVDGARDMGYAERLP